MSVRGQIDPIKLIVIAAVIVVGLLILAVVSGAICPMVEGGTPAPPGWMC